MNSQTVLVTLREARAFLNGAIVNLESVCEHCHSDDVLVELQGVIPALKEQVRAVEAAMSA